MSYRSVSLVLLWAVCVSLPCLTQQNSSLLIAVVDNQGNAITNSVVRIVGLDRIGIPTSNGTVLFKEVPPNSYSVSVTRPGFKDKVVAGVAVPEAKMAELRVMMEQSPPKASDYKISETLASPQLYAKALTKINEPLVCSDTVSKGKERYRFLWVPTFSSPVPLQTP